MKKLTKLLSLNKIWSKTRKQKYQATKVFPISMEVLGLSKSRLAVPWKKIISLSTGKVSGLRNRLVITMNFIKLLVRLKENHGADFTIKWLKCCYVALQKAQANDNLPSLRSLEPSLPMPRLINGLPAFIKPADRALIKAGNPSIIRFWSSLFSVYRILKCSYKLKVDTITNPFSGDKEGLNELKGVALKLNFFATLPGFSVWRNTCQLAPQKFL